MTIALICGVEDYSAQELVEQKLMRDNYDQKKF